MSIPVSLTEVGAPGIEPVGLGSFGLDDDLLHAASDARTKNMAARLLMLKLRVRQGNCLPGKLTLGPLSSKI
jgi:hypothetical protein